MQDEGASTMGGQVGSCTDINLKRQFISVVAM